MIITLPNGEMSGRDLKYGKFLDSWQLWKKAKEKQTVSVQLSKVTAKAVTYSDRLIKMQSWLGSLVLLWSKDIMKFVGLSII